MIKNVTININDRVDKETKNKENEDLKINLENSQEKNSFVNISDKRTWINSGFLVSSV